MSEWNKNVYVSARALCVSDQDRSLYSSLSDKFGLQKIHLARQRQLDTLLRDHKIQGQGELINTFRYVSPM
jgi:hypothetical protein